MARLIPTSPAPSPTTQPLDALSPLSLWGAVGVGAVADTNQDHRSSLTRQTVPQYPARHARTRRTA